MSIKISVRGAYPDEMARGLAAARAVFERAGMTPEACAAGPAEQPLASLWHEADLAAARACCSGWPVVPATAHLSLAD